MMLAAPELVIAEIVEQLDEIEVAAELQHRVLAKGVMRGEEGSEFQTRHEVSRSDVAAAAIVGTLVSYEGRGFNAVAGGAAMHFPGPRKVGRLLPTRRIFMGGIAAFAGVSAASGGKPTP
jgi:hypothetical protein